MAVESENLEKLRKVHIESLMPDLYFFEISMWIHLKQIPHIVKKRSVSK